MTLAQLKALVCVAKFGSVRAAARFLGLSQPAVSALLRRLENSSNSELFIRNSRPLRLSNSGELLHRQAQVIVELSDNMATIAALPDPSPLKVALDYSLSTQESNALIAALLKKYPLRNFEFLRGGYQTIHPLLMKQEVDIAITLPLPANPPLLDSQSIGLRTLVCVENPISSTEYFVQSERGEPIWPVALPDSNVNIGFNRPQDMLEAIAHLGGRGWAPEKEVEAWLEQGGIKASSQANRSINLTLYWQVSFEAEGALIGEISRWRR
jgi:DNA-binding transcriptional LysR family regulator